MVELLILFTSLVFSGSLYIINQKPMIHRTDIHCITTWVAHSFGEIWQCICLFCGFKFTGKMALLSSINFYFDSKIRLCLIALMAGMRKFIFAQESFYLQGILNDINEQDTPFLDYKQLVSA